MEIKAIREKIRTANSQKERLTAKLEVQREELKKLLARLHNEFGIDPSQIEQRVAKMTEEQRGYEQEVAIIMERIDKIIDVQKAEY